MTIKIYLYENTILNKNNNINKRPIIRKYSQFIFDSIYKADKFIKINYLDTNRTNSGRPYINNIRYDFNLSNSDKWIALATIEQDDTEKQIRIGIDIENIEKQREFLKIAKRFTKLEELDYLKNNDLIYSFYLSWTIREASLKSQGKGIYHLNTINIDYQNKEIHCNLLDKGSKVYCYQYKNIIISLYVPAQYNKQNIFFYLVDDNSYLSSFFPKNVISLTVTK